MAKIYISLGSNIEPAHYIRVAVKELTALLGPLRLSSVFESEAVGFSGDNFLNMVVAAETELSVAELVSQFKQIELRNGRAAHAVKFAPRTLDLDLLLYDNAVITQPVVLPRAEILTNAFVLWPLAELAPALQHPIAGLPYQTLWQNYDKSQQRLWQVDFDWQ
ncbi:2-amino-4-hydroxy-6-hydroxymethyldihydropteridine diphosphokinase [Shewanella avicenniae]|uniref:2-amino-4-hydroxy-6-hydroxymethyldihydropteridine diphosphokinase n=1 Tax=Shewanella avicenniae TaxID=2814294 RepID=A0ABX7QT71_9GAMM|nr:2-amino-4-hydroxy-6-hydroxymethyldihydropteridine diphosphokinase [Shewanella avicenniae]QSX34668.1 2-amino-4-hydroxy-6-hydroxymethyldihydropteridine diphosphokinase [Shewanella avicenniae]